MADLIIGLIVFAAMALAIVYIYKAKKSGVKCIGCPAAGNCSSKNEEKCSCGGCSCGCHSDLK